MLTEQDAVKIYQFQVTWKAELSRGVPCRSLRGQSGPISRLFGVSSRTVRDIWNRQTWAYATKNLWTQEPEIKADNLNPSGYVSSETDSKVQTVQNHQNHPE